MLRTALIIDGNSDGGQRALQAMEGSIEQSEAAAKKLAAAYSAVDVSTTRLAGAQTTAKAQIDATKAALAAGEIGLEQYNRELLETRTALGLVEAEHRNHVKELRDVRAGMQAVTGASGQQRVGLQQLAMNMSDMTTMWSLGAKGSQIFASQMGQTLQAVQLLGGGAGKFSAFMSNPWVQGITMATMVLAPLAAALFDSKEATDANTMSAEDLIKALDELHDAAVRTTQSTYASIEASLRDAEAKRTQAQEARRAAVAELELAKAKAGAAGASISPGAPGYSNTYNLGEQGKQEANARSFQAEIDRLNKSIGAGTEAIRLYQGQLVGKYLDEGLNAGTAATGKFERAQDSLNKQLAAGTISIGKYASDLRSAKQTLAEEQAAADKSGGSHRARAAALTDEQRAYNKAFDAASNYIASLGDQISKVGLSAKEIRLLEASRAADAAATEEQAKVIGILSGALEKSIADQEYLNALKQAKQGTDGLQTELDQLKREAEAIGLVGWERERLLLILENEAKIRPLLTQMLDAELKGQTALAQELQKQIDLLNGITRAKIDAGNLKDGLEQEAEAAAEVNGQLREMISLLNNLGGLGSVLGGILGIANGDYNNLGGGQIGQLLSFVLNQKDDSGKKVGDDVKNALDGLFKEVFGKDGLFGNTLSDVLQGAGVGMATSRAILGDKGTAADIGAALGGAAGKVLGTALLGPIGGAIGSVVGGLLGGAIGGLFASTPKGSATINGLGVTNTSGKGEQLDNSKKAAGSILDSLDQIAEALGGAVGAVSGVSIGMRKDSWKVDPTGQGRTKGSGVLDFGDDAEAAAMAAMKLLIERGVIGGIRASTQNILAAGTDLQTQINKAVAWQDILDEAEHSSSSFAKSLGDLKDQFDEIGKIAIEAKASTEELAEVQALLIRKQQELIDQAMASYRSTFYSDAENVAYAKQAISSKLTPLGYGSVDTVDEYKALVAATDALANPDLFGTLMDLSDEFGVLKDATDKAADSAAAAAEQEKALAQQRGQLEVDILRAEGRDAEAEAKDRQLRLAAADASLRPLLQDLFKAQDIANARDALKDAFEKAKAPFEDTIDKMDNLVDSLKDVRAGLDDTADGAVSIAQAEAKLREVGYKANVLGDQDALGQLGGVINDFASAARKGAGSQLELDRLMAEARRYADAGIGSASAAKDIAQQQLDAMTAQVGQLVDLNENVLSVHDAILQLQQLQGGGTGAGTPTPAQQQDEDRNRQREIRDGIRDIADHFRAGRERSDRWDRILTRLEQNGRLRVTTAEEETA